MLLWSMAVPHKGMLAEVGGLGVPQICGWGCGDFGERGVGQHIAWWPMMQTTGSGGGRFPAACCFVDEPTPGSLVDRL